MHVRSPAGLYWKPQLTLNVLIHSYRFPPDLGGLENAGELIARGLHELGQAVVVVTRTRGARLANRNKPYRVVEQPKVIEFINLLKWSNVVLHNNLSSYVVWPLLIVRRPWLVVHQTWLPGRTDSGWIRGAFKRRLIRYATNVSISRAVAKSLGIASDVIGNPYDDVVFKRIPQTKRIRDLVFVGRLVSDKGVDVLLRALALSRRQGRRHTCTIVGEGPSRRQLEATVAGLDLTDDVTFLGVKVGAELAEAMNRHRIIVIPSSWDEPFGIVALEGIACGCVALAAQSGGLPEAVVPVENSFRKTITRPWQTTLTLLWTGRGSWRDTHNRPSSI